MTRREKDIFNLLIHSSYDCKAELHNAKATRQDSILVSYTGGRGPSTGTIFYCLPRHFSRKLYWMWNGQLTNQHSYLKCQSCKTQVNLLAKILVTRCTFSMTPKLYVFEHAWLGQFGTAAFSSILVMTAPCSVGFITTGIHYRVCLLSALLSCKDFISTLLLWFVITMYFLIYFYTDSIISELNRCGGDVTWM